MEATSLGKIEGYCVQKKALELRIGDIAITHAGHFHTILHLERNGSYIKIKSDFGDYQYYDTHRLGCIQKEDPAIQIAINEKIKALKSYKKFVKDKAEHLMARDLHLVGHANIEPHLWMVMETSDEHEYWKDNVYNIKVLFKGNKICCAAANTGDEPLLCDCGILILDCKKYNFGKHIWR